MLAMLNFADGSTKQMQLDLDGLGAIILDNKAFVLQSQTEIRAYRPYYTFVEVKYVVCSTKAEPANKKGAEPSEDDEEDQPA